MKNQIILWLSSLVIIFLTGFAKNVTDENYPVTGTFGIEGKKVSYKLDKESFDKNSYKNIIISDINGVQGKIIWIMDNKRYETNFTAIDRGLEAEIPTLNIGEKIDYKIVLNYKDEIFEIPRKEFVTLTFWGFIPSPVKILHFIFLYGGLMMTLRCLLELFNQNLKLKKYSVLTSSIFITLTLLIHPLYNSYKLGAINKNVPSVVDILEIPFLIMMILWIIGTILIFNKQYTNQATILITSATILLFFLT